MSGINRLIKQKNIQPTEAEIKAKRFGKGK